MSNFETFSMGEMTVEEKTEILAKAMERGQPDFEDFRGKPGFSDGVIRRDRQRLMEKNGRSREVGRDVGAGDRYAKEAEPIVTYILNQESFMPSRETFAYLASEFDDKINGTDVVFGVERRDHSGYMAFSVDVATGTRADSIEKKFRESRRRDWLAGVDYCMRDDERWSEPEAPHFILGMMPADLDKAIDKVRIGQGTIVREPDPTTDFMLASEMYEQIKMQIKDVETNYDDEVARRQLDKLKDLRLMVRAKLYKVCGVKGETKETRAEDFERKYGKNVRVMRGDLVYRNILDEVRRVNDQNNGRMAMNSVG